MPPRFPDYIEPIVAWRGWTVDEYGGLRGSAVRELWMPGERHTARCTSSAGLNNRHAQWDAPKWQCTCGIYAYKTLASELQNLMGQDWGYWNKPRTTYAEQVLGQVNLWGRIIEHAVGYRAQYAYPKAVIVSEEIGKVRIDTIRKEYKIEVQTVPCIGDYLVQLIRNFAKGER